MKNYEHPEFFFLHALHDLREKYPDAPEVAELYEKARDIVTENTLYMMKDAVLYALSGRPEDLRVDGKEKLLDVLGGVSKYFQNELGKSQAE